MSGTVFSPLYTHNLTYSLEQPHEVAATMIFISHMKKLLMQVAIQVERNYIQGDSQQEGRKCVPTWPGLFCSFTVLSSGNLHLLLPEKSGLFPVSPPPLWPLAGWGVRGGERREQQEGRCREAVIYLLTGWVEAGAPKPPSVWQPRNSEEQRKP